MKKINLIEVKDAYGSIKWINPEHISLVERSGVTMGYGSDKGKTLDRYSIHILGVSHVIVLDKDEWDKLQFILK